MPHNKVVDVNGISFHVVTAGNGLPLVLLHGFTGSAETWEPLTATLANDYTIIVPELIGHARSQAPDHLEHYKLPRAASDLVELLNVLGYKRAAWIGYSLGGRTAIQVASDHPSAVGTLILEGASPGIKDQAERAKRRQDDDNLADRIERDGISAFVDEWEKIPLFASQLSLPCKLRARIRATRLSHSATGLANSLRGMGTGAQVPLHERLSTINTPTLLITGALDTKYVGLAQEMAQKLPDATMRVVGGAGHAVHIERPREFTQLVQAHLHSVYPTTKTGD